MNHGSADKVLPELISKPEQMLCIVGIGRRPGLELKPHHSSRPKFDNQIDLPTQASCSTVHSSGPKRRSSRLHCSKRWHRTWKISLLPRR